MAPLNFSGSLPVNEIYAQSSTSICLLAGAFGDTCIGVGSYPSRCVLHGLSHEILILWSNKRVYCVRLKRKQFTCVFGEVREF